MSHVSPAMTLLMEHLDLQEAANDPDAKWEVFQVGMISREGMLSITNKSRQVGWSWTAAAKATANAILIPRSTHLFVSINHDEAAEKIRYANAVVDALDASVRPKLIKQNTFGLELQNGSRLISHPCKPPRGKAKATVYLDEFAHYPIDKLVYQGALPVISKGGSIEIGSSPFGAGGRFWEIMTESTQKFPGYVRRTVQWWKIFALCRNIPLARVQAPYMTTEERVYKFGTPRLIQIYENMLREDFQQEYECMWLDEAVAWIDWEIIKKNQLLDQAGKLWHKRVRGVDAAQAAIDDLMAESIAARVEMTFVGGFDVGRTHDKAEIIICGESTTGGLPYRLGITLDNVKFDDQQGVVNYLMDNLPVRRFLIDKTGLGMQIAEHTEDRYPGRALGIFYDSASKQAMSVELKRMMQRSWVPLPLERELMYQIHSIRRSATDAKNLKFNTTEKKEHHADKYWALAMAVYSPVYEGFTAIAEEEDNFLSDWRGS